MVASGFAVRVQSPEVREIKEIDGGTVVVGIPLSINIIDADRKL